MDRNLAFFLDIGKADNRPTNAFGVKPEQRTYTVTDVRVNKDGKQTETGKESVNYTLYPSAFTTWSNGGTTDINRLQYINYRGVSGTNEFDPLATERREQADTSLTSIMRWSQQYPAAQLRAVDFAYLKDINSFPANRMVVLRRFGSDPAPNDLLSASTTLIPSSVMVGRISIEDEVALELGFAENWEIGSKDGLINVINDMIGIKGLKLPTFDGMGGLGQAIMTQVGKRLGLLNSANNPLGDPDVLHEAATRKAEFEGLKFDMTIKFTTEYLQKYIDGVDPRAAMLDVLANATNMGTSNSKFIVTGDATDKINDMVKRLQAGDAKGLIDDMIDAISEGLRQAVEGVTGFVKGVAETAVNDGAPEALQKVADELYAGTVELLRSVASRYTWRLRGAVGAMSGMHTAPWHVTMGNPKDPWFSCGNMVVTDSKVEVFNDFAFNDFPNRVRVTYTLKPGRTLGAQEIMSIFNAGKGRIYHVPTDKTRYTFDK